MEATKKPFCAKHKAEYDKWSDFGPWNPVPKGITTDIIKNQLKGIKETHKRGNACSDDPNEAFHPPISMLSKPILTAEWKA